MKARWKTQFVVLETSSKFHNQVGQILAQHSKWSSMKCFQEVPVSDLVPGYPYTNHHVDWYIDPIKTILELHGAQHYKVVNYGGVSYEDARKDFREIQYRDSLKKTALLEAGYRYVEVPYKEQKNLTGEYLFQYIISHGEEHEAED